MPQSGSSKSANSVQVRLARQLLEMLNGVPEDGEFSFSPDDLNGFAEHNLPEVIRTHFKGLSSEGGRYFLKEDWGVEGLREAASDLLRGALLRGAEVTLRSITDRSRR